MNWFEGGKRIRILVQVLWCLGVALFGYQGVFDAEVKAYYTTDWVTKPFVKAAHGRCGGNDSTEWVNRKTQKGARVSVTLCFVPQEGKDGVYRIPFKADEHDPTQAWLGESWRSEVTTYTDKRAEAFVIPRGDEAELDRAVFWERLKVVKAYLLAALIGVSVIWGVSATIGWVAKGFVAKKAGE